MSAQQESGGTLYATLGGGKRLQAIVRRFVAEVEALPNEATLRRMFGDTDMDAYRQRLFEFLSGWLGGPPLYTQRHGLPNLRERHRRVAIGSAERDQWLQCMRRALAAEVDSAESRERIELAFWQMANSLRNRDEGPPNGQGAHAVAITTARSRLRAPPGRVR